MPQPTEAQLRELIGATAARTFTLERAQVDADARTVELTFSSETPVEQWFGDEILDHSPGACDLSRLNTGGAVLVCHDRTDQIGAVVPGSASIDSEAKVGRATVLFSQSARGREIMQDVADGIRSTVSVRYIRNAEMQLESTDGDGYPTYRVTQWIPLEISFEPIPADPTVGTADQRSLDEQLAQQLTELRNKAEQLGATLTLPGADVRTTQPAESERTSTTMPAANEPTNETASADVQRAHEIAAIGELAGIREFAVDLTLDQPEITVAAARTLIKAERKRLQTEPPTQTAEEIARNQGHVEVISRHAGSLRSFKGPDAQKTAFRAGQFLRAALFSDSGARRYCRENGIALLNERSEGARASVHSESDNDSGGVLLQPEFENVMIDLREEFGDFRRFANVVPMSTDAKSRPRRTSGLQAYPIGARGASRAITASKKGWDRVELQARKWGVLTKYEIELEEDATIKLADDLFGEIAYAFAQTEDDCGFNGDGTADFHGILGIIPKILSLGTNTNTAGLVQATGATWDSITREDMIAVMGKLPKYAYKRGPVWHCSQAFWASVMVRITLAAGGVTAAEIEGQRMPLFLGWPVETSQVLAQATAVSQIPALFGVMRLGVMFGDRRGVTIRTTDSNDDDFENDLIAVKGTERFAISVHDVGNNDATAANRVAGPIVAIQTKAS